MPWFILSCTTALDELDLQTNEHALCFRQAVKEIRIAPRK
jgi:hypothetical protein